MQLGAFSISLAVKDLEASRKFYEKFGFEPFAWKIVPPVGASPRSCLEDVIHQIGQFYDDPRTRYRGLR
jgi:catechol 2,3-dioxygenase-like lactoylglutathione lyase family enzyme